MTRTMERWGSGGRGRHLAALTAVAAVFVGLLLVVSPAAATSPPTKSSKTLKAPYSGSPGIFGLLDAFGCGYTTAIPVSPVFNQSTGVVSASLNASAHSCGANTSGAEIGVEAGIVLNSTFKAASTGSFKVSVTWSYDYQVYLAAKDTKKGQVSEAYVTLGAGADLYNQTTDTSALIGSNYTQYVNGTSPALHTYKFSVTYSATLKLVKGDVYYIGTAMEIAVVAFVDHTGGSATASINLGTSTYKATLESVVQP